ncbi:hypothetical protein HUU51_01730 [Candidatus Gracilibacteria bacterium]|nr:hypothetical protein [Candidatus Gracilibacteria bacterium]
MGFLKKEFKLYGFQIILIIIGTFSISLILTNNINIKNGYDSKNITKDSTNNNFEAQYITAKSGGNQLDICTMAKIVNISYLQINDNENYKKWMGIEKEECDKLIK